MKTHALILGGLVAVASTVTAGEVVDLSKIDLSKLPPAATKKGLTFSKDIQPILAASCTRCHGQDRPKAGLQLTSLDTLLKGGKDGKVVVPGDSKKSLLVIAAAQIDEETAMPPKRGPGRGGPGGPGGGRPPGGPQGGRRSWRPRRPWRIWATAKTADSRAGWIDAGVGGSGQQVAASGRE